MSFIKVCSKCGTVNPANRTECSNCHKDLTREKKITEEKYNELKAAEEAAAEEKGAPEPPQGDDGAARGNAGVTEDNAAPRMVYICENCGTPNDTKRTVCISCGDSLAGIVPTPFAGNESEENNGQNTDNTGNTGAGNSSETDSTVELYVRKTHITSADGSFSLELTEGDHRLGRKEEGSGYLSDKMYVSGFHAVLSVSNGEYFIEDFSTNGTFINGSRIDKGKKVKVVPEADLIGLGSHKTSDFLDQAAYFRITESEQCSLDASCIR